MKFFETSEDVSKAKKKAFPWLVFGVPIGCAIGVAIRNLALGIGIGLLIGATFMTFQAKKEERKISPVVVVALIIACAAMLVLGFIAKK